MRIVAFFVVATATALLSNAGEPLPQPSPEELLLQSAGLSSDGDALLRFFRERTRTTADLNELLQMARQLGDSSADKRALAKAKLLGSGPWAIPALRHVVNDLENPLAALRARQCLERLEGAHGTELLVAAAKLLAARKPADGTSTLLAFLPFVGDPAVADAVKTALDSMAARPGKTDAALLAALADPLPLRRAVAAEVLAGSGRADVMPEVRKLLADPKAQVRLRVALALTQRLDEKAIGVLIDLLVELPPLERRQAEKVLHELAGAWTPTLLLTVEDEQSRRICQEAWASWWRKFDGPALTAAFRQRTLNEQDTVAAKALVKQLGAKIYLTRERAAAELIAQGTKVVGLLREASNSTDPELAQRAAICLNAIAKNEARDKLPLTAPRLLAIRKPAGASESLLAFLPFADDRAMSDEIVTTLSLLVRVEGKPDVALLKALSDPLPMRRIAAAEVLAGAGMTAHPALRKLLADADSQVRLQAALALVHAKDRAAVPTLIELVVDLPAAQTLEADDVLRFLAGARAPARLMDDNAAARNNLRAAWLSWWKDHGASVNLAVLERPMVGAGLMVVAELGPNRAKKKAGFGGGALVQPAAKKGNPANPPAAESDRIVGIDRSGHPQWKIEDLEHPIDFQVLPGDRVLIAEYVAKRVTERDLKGKILWQVNLAAQPMNVQRLANGNTFVALYGTVQATGGYLLLEIDRQGKTVSTIDGLGGAPAPAPGAPFGPGGFGGTGNPRAGIKMADGQMACTTSSGTCIRLDPTGKETKRFSLGAKLNLGAGGGIPSLVGNIDVTPKGHVIIAHNNMVAEYDSDGKIAWKAEMLGNRATRLANGNTLIASETKGVFELDATGKTVWQYQPPVGYQAVRARQVGNAPATGK